VLPPFPLFSPLEPLARNKTKQDYRKHTYQDHSNKNPTMIKLSTKKYNTVCFTNMQNL
jgi:hypothetical protein